MSFENREKLPSGLEEERFQKQALSLEDPAWPCYPEQIYLSAMSLYPHLSKTILVAPMQLPVQGLAQFDSQ